jgi:hypothetical protein
VGRQIEALDAVLGCAMILLRIVSSAGFMLGALFLLWPLPVHVRIALAGVYFLIGAVAVVGELVLLRLDDAAEIA